VLGLPFRLKLIREAFVKLDSDPTFKSNIDMCRRMFDQVIFVFGYGSDREE